MGDRATEDEVDSDSRGVLDLLHAGQSAAAIGAALELGLFWLLDERPRRAEEVGRELGIPGRRAEFWLESLQQTGLLDSVRGGYRPSAWAREAILETYSEDTWAFLALESREALEALVDLPARLRARSGQQRHLPTYIARMSADPARARRFTRMLGELHAPLAAQIARSLPLRDARCLLDLGGGSGVVSIALARRNPELEITVVDIPNVCDAGREIVAERGLERRIAFVPADLAGDVLPGGFDAAIECDVGLYDIAFFERVRAALRPGGRFVIVDELPADDCAPTPHLEWAVARSLDDPDFVPPTVASVVSMLKAAGFSHVDHGELARSRGMATTDPRPSDVAMSLLIATRGPASGSSLANP